MTDGSDYVFDWYPTLDPLNPWLYETDDWRVDQNEWPFSSFTGFVPTSPNFSLIPG
jgi:hypothetical protein